MSAPIILAALAVAFLLAAVFKMSGGTPLMHQQVRTWLLVAIIFAGVSGWLFLR